MDFVFDRLADGRALKCLTVVDDATQEAVAISPDRGKPNHRLEVPTRPG
jgi:hypothetical protein